MSQPYIGEIRMFAGSFAPAGWAFCAGQIMPISENDTLFQLIGTTYGGDGEETFALPDFQGRLPAHMGTGPGGLSTYQLGQTSGTGAETVTLNQQQVPIHNHAVVCSVDIANKPSPNNAVLGQSTVAQMYYADVADAALHANSIATTGGSQPHDNMQPYLCVSFIISLFGIFPTQT